MLEVLICYINERLEALKIFKTINSLCELIKDGEQTYPAHYCGKDEYKNILDIDSTKGLIYHRINGNVTRTEIDKAISGCDVQIRQVYPIRIVAMVPKNILNSDNEYIDVKICENIMNAITLKNSKQINSLLKTDVVTIKIKDFNVNRDNIISQEFANVEKMHIDYRYAVCAIDIDIEIEASQSCFNYWHCGDGLCKVDFNPPPAFIDGGDAGGDEQFNDPDTDCPDLTEPNTFVGGGDAEDNEQFNDNDAGLQTNC